MDAFSQGMLAGTAHTTINPRPGAPLIGYPSDRPNTGIEYGLFARAAVFGRPKEDRPAAALLALDTLGTNAGLVAEIRMRAAQALPGLEPSAIMVAATHTHSAPTLDPFRKNRCTSAPDPAYRGEVLEASVAALRAAWQAREHVLVRAGLTEAKLGHNRRAVSAEGVATNEWLDPDGRHRGYFNPSVRFLAFQHAATGRLCLLLSMYGCHPVTLGQGNTVASADYPGWMIRTLEARLGAPAIHVTGAAANINPREGLFADPGQARPMGEALAKAIESALPHARRIDASVIAAHAETLTLTLGPDARENYTARAAQSRDGRTLDSEVQALRLGEAVLVGAPGELFAEIGVAIENGSPFDPTIVVGYANDNLGYLCTEAAMREGGYEARNVLTPDAERPICEAARRAIEAVSAGRPAAALA
ncbi:MAG: hypothetical protein KIS92_05425 [Planctomycetota bacterium]|nr:hypothetical protein [Planctomycetota bacterium]